MGAGANVYVGIKMDVKPREPIMFYFRTKGLEDMNKSGHDAKVIVKDKGITAISVGYVEASMSLFHGHTWLLSYTSDTGGYSGAAESSWAMTVEHNNEVELIQYPDNTVICMSKADCNATKQVWDAGSAEDLYIIFKPE